MKKNYFLGIAASAVITMAGYLGFALTNQQEQLSDIQLANIEALADGEIQSGDPCYNKGNYDASYPEAVVCGNPCYRQPHYPGFLNSTSVCP